MRSYMIQPILVSFNEAVADLLFPSERAHPFEVLIWKQSKSAFSSDDLIRLAQLSGDVKIEVVDMDEFFSIATTEESWHEEPERRDVRRFRHLVETLRQHLSSIKIFRAGEVSVDVFIVGKATKDEWIVLKTRVVET